MLLFPIAGDRFLCSWDGGVHLWRSDHNGRHTIQDFCPPMEKRRSLWSISSIGLKQEITKLFLGELKRKGLNLDGNPRKKKALIEFLLCLPEIFDSVLTKSNIQKGFVESGMIESETETFPVFDRLIGTCKRWVSSTKTIGIPKAEKEHCIAQFQSLMKIQLDEGQITYSDTKCAGIPLGECRFWCQLHWHMFVLTFKLFRQIWMNVVKSVMRTGHLDHVLNIGNQLTLLMQSSAY